MMAMVMFMMMVMCKLLLTSPRDRRSVKAEGGSGPAPTMAGKEIEGSQGKVAEPL